MHIQPHTTKQASLRPKTSRRDLLPTEPPRVIRPPGPGDGLEHLADVVVNVLELLALLEIAVREPAGGARGDLLPVAAPCEGEAGDAQEAAGDAVAQGGCVLGDCVDGEVLAVAAAVAAPDGDDDEGEDEEEDEGDDGGDDECLLFCLKGFCVSVYGRDCYALLFLPLFLYFFSFEVWFLVEGAHIL